MKDYIKGWLEEAKKLVLVFSCVGGEFIIYKGFKIMKLGDEYSIQDVRLSNMYTPVSQKCFALFKKSGFIRAVDEMVHQRDLVRVKAYKRKAELLYDKRGVYTKELPKNKNLNEKRIRNINRRIEEYIDLIFFYEVRIKQFNTKNNQNE